MMAIAIHSIIVLITAFIAVFVALVAINIALFLRLRSSIPQKPVVYTDM